MARTKPFEKHGKEYDEWFIRNYGIYQAEINAIKNFILKDKKGVEIGVGSGRFATPFNIKIGIDPSEKMIDIAKSRGVEAIKGTAENIPFKDKKFDFVLIVTTICFVDDVFKSFKEIFRILKNEGFVIVGFIDRKSYLGKKYKSKKKESKFYGYATFFSAEEVIDILEKTCFKDFNVKQTIFADEKDKKYEVRNGYDEGSFVVIKAVKTK